MQVLGDPDQAYAVDDAAGDMHRAGIARHARIQLVETHGKAVAAHAAEFGEHVLAFRPGFRGEGDALSLQGAGEEGLVLKCEDRLGGRGRMQGHGAARLHIGMAVAFRHHHRRRLDGVAVELGEEGGFLEALRERREDGPR